MITSLKTSKRPYLARGDRRRALLDVAAGIVELRGWSALTMISLAEESGVSRQLVYQHFSSINEVMVETMQHLFRDHYEYVQRCLENPDLTPVQLVRIAQQQTTAESPQRIRALWQIMTASDADDTEIALISRELRKLIITLWTPALARHTKLTRKQNGVLAWMLNMAIWGAHQMVQDGELDARGATELADWMALRLLDGGA